MDLFKVERSDEGSYFIANVPGGEHDVIVTAGTVAVNLTAPDAKGQGRRLSKVKFLDGARNEPGEIDLPPLRSVRGRATLLGATDHAGIDVYVPGTSLAAKTDAEGNYAMTGVPDGMHNLFFERDGYYRGQIEAVEVAGDMAISDIQLALSTGANGAVFLQSGAAIHYARTVSVVVAATASAVLMKVAENQGFVGATWTPLKTSFSYTFDTPGTKTLWVTVADANGLESSPFSSNINIQLFPDDIGLAIAGGASLVDSRSQTATLTVPPNAYEMRVSADAAFSGVAWGPPASSVALVFPAAGSCTLFVQFRDADGFTSPVYSDAIEVDLFQGAAISVANGDDVITTRSIPITVTVPANATWARYSTSADFLGASWEPVAASKVLVVPDEGEWTVHVQFKDDDGMMSPILNDEVEVDLFPSGAVTIAGGSSTVFSRTVSLGVSAPGNAVEMCIASTSTFSPSDCVPVATSASFTFEGDGLRTVYLQFLDADGFESEVYSDDVAVQLWRAMPTTNGPGRRENALLFNAGTKLVMQGGYRNDGATTTFLTDGAIFDTATSTWLSLGAGSPSQSFDTATNAVWTGAKAIFWNAVGSYPSKGGYAFTAASNGWASLQTTGEPSFRISSSSVWTGSKMIVWGGHDYSNDTFFDTGAIYDPSNNSWTSMSTTGAPTPRGRHSAVWTGSKMVVWGGCNHPMDRDSSQFQTGGLYNPADDSWTAMSTIGAPSGRERAGLAWTGTHVLVYGGNRGGTALNDAYLYDPVGNSWTTIAGHSGTGTHVLRTMQSGNRIFFFHNYTKLAKHYFDTSTNTFKAIPTYVAAGELNPFEAVNAVVVGNVLYVWGHNDPRGLYLDLSLF
jgi:N-acetylneuraminic acid mutarotase